MFGTQPSGPLIVCSMHQSNSSSLSPFQAKVGMFTAAMAAAASSWVLKILQEDQRRVAPSSTSVSMSTAVCTVMCRQPAIRAPARGLLAPNSVRRLMSPGISFSAMVISLRPHLARLMSLTL